MANLGGEGTPVSVVFVDAALGQSGRHGDDSA
jgi:hypothetical protein